MWTAASTADMICFVPRRLKQEQAQEILSAMTKHLAEVGCVRLLNDVIVADGPDMAELVESVLGFESDSQQRKVAKKLAAREFVKTFNGRQVTMASSGGKDLKTYYRAGVLAAKSAAGQTPAHDPKRPRGRPRKVIAAVGGGTTLKQ